VPWNDNFAAMMNGSGQAPIKRVLDIDEIQLGLPASLGHRPKSLSSAYCRASMSRQWAHPA
jgi:hypothetical protein